MKILGNLTALEVKSSLFMAEIRCILQPRIMNESLKYFPVQN